MDNNKFNTEAIGIWGQVASNGAPGHWHLEFDVYHRLLKLFQVGEYFYWVFNLVEFTFDTVSGNIKSMLGYLPSEFTFNILMDNVHPEDRPYFLNFENKAREFLEALPVEKLMKYKVRHDFRVKDKDGKYIRLLHQAIIIQHDSDGRILRTIGIETDITHLKPEGKPVFSIIGLDGEPSYFDVNVNEIFAISEEILSKRERQILLLIMEGKLSKEISQLLHISKQTVDTHRKNMLLKTNLKNTSELIVKAIKQGWV